MATTGEKLKKLREERDLSMQDLADSIGVHKGTIFKWEHDMVPLRKTSTDNLEGLARALHVPVDELLNADPVVPVRINSQDYELRNGSTIVRVERTPKTEPSDRLLLYALDVLMMQNGFRTDYTPDGDVLLIRGDVAKPVTEAELLAMAQDISQLAGGQLRRLFGGGS